jgi:hypothetical protein
MRALKDSQRVRIIGILATENGPAFFPVPD